MFTNFLHKNNKVIVLILFVFIILLSLFPRSIDALNQNPIFGFDQGREMLAAKSIVVDHKLILIGAELGAGSAGISGIFQGPGFYYLLTIPFVIFNGNPVGAVALMLFFGLLTIATGFYIGNKILGLYAGLLTALIISISPVLIAQSRFEWSPNLPTFFILLSFYFTYLFSKNKNLYIFLASFFAGYIYNLETAIAIPLSLALITYSVFIFRKKYKKYIYLVIGFLVAYSPMIFFEIRHGLMGLKGLIYYLTVNGKTHQLSLLSFMQSHLQSFIYNFKDTFPIDNTIFSILFLLCLFSISIYLISKEKDKDLKHFFGFLVFLIPVNLFVFFFLRNIVWTYYLTDLSLVYILLLTYVVASLYKRKYFNLSIVSLALVSVLVVVGAYSAFKISIHDYSDYGGTAKLKGKMDAVDYIYKDAKGSPFGLLVFSPPVYTYPYDYLIWWFGQKKYNYIPYAQKKDTFYLLIETDGAKPWSYKGWLETVIKSGKIKSTVTLPSGFIVQKRIEE